AVTRLHLEQSPLTLFKVGVAEVIHSDNTCTRVFLIVGQRQQGQKLPLGVSSEAECLDDCPNVSCRVEVEISSLLVGERTSKKLCGSTSKLGFHIPTRKIREWHLLISKVPQARDQQDNADGLAICFEEVAIPR